MKKLLLIMLLFPCMIYGFSIESAFSGDNKTHNNLVSIEQANQYRNTEFLISASWQDTNIGQAVKAAYDIDYSLDGDYSGFFDVRFNDMPYLSISKRVDLAAGLGLYLVKIRTFDFKISDGLLLREERLLNSFRARMRFYYSDTIASLMLQIVAPEDELTFKINLEQMLLQKISLVLSYDMIANRKADTFYSYLAGMKVTI